MNIPKLMRVGKNKYINPENISTFIDHGKWMELGMVGVGTLKINEKGYVDAVRSAILNRIDNDTTTTNHEMDTICAMHYTCKGASEDCWGRDGKKCYTTMIEPIPLNPDNTKLEDLTADPEANNDCGIYEYCSSTDCLPNEKTSNIPNCFRFLNEPDDCDTCPIKDRCKAKGSGTCPVDLNKKSE